MKKTAKKTANKMIELFRFNVAGVQFSDYQKLKSYTPGTEVKLYWEKSNKFDDRAIRIEYDGVKIGYVPRSGEYQNSLHDCREAGRKVKAELTSWNKNNSSWYMFVVKCSAEDSKKKKTNEYSFDGSSKGFFPGNIDMIDDQYEDVPY